LKTLTLAAVSAFALAGAAPGPAARLDDAQILYVLHTLNEAEILAGKQAQPRSHDPDVKSLAETIIDDHGSVAVTAAEVAQKLHLTPKASPLSADLDRKGVQARERLVAVDGIAQEQAYVANEVAVHRSNEALIRETLIPAARSGQVKGLLMSAADLERSHRLDAEQLPRPTR
jgi:putative membrane protein